MPDPLDRDPAGAFALSGRLLAGRFRIERALGSGGMGEVLLARDTLLNRRVALKRWRSDHSDASGRREALLKEARRASQINDRRIAAIYDVIEQDDEILLVMEYVEGATLRERMAQPVGIDDFWRLALPCVEALGAAHAHGVIHRDIKPENLMVTGDGQVKILDFGIARRSQGFTETSTTHTDMRTQSIAGTPQYMAPEAHLGRDVDERSDLYSLGVVFYELLTARRPFADGPYGAIVSHVLSTTPEPPHEVNPAVGAELSSVVARMLAKRPDERFGSAAELLQALEGARDGRAPPPATTGRTATAATPARAAPARHAPALALIALAALAALWMAWRAWGAPALPQDRNVAVMAPETPGADEDFASFALGFTEQLSNRLQRQVDTTGFQAASFQEVLDGKLRSAQDARKVLGVSLALRPTLEQRPDVFRAQLDLFETARGRRIARRVINTPVTQPFEFLERTCRESALLLGLPARGAGPVRIGLRGAGTLRFYLQGRGRVLQGSDSAHAQRAVLDFLRACRTEPEAAVAQAGLAAGKLAAHQRNASGDWLAGAEEAARLAVSLDDARSEGHMVLGLVLATRRDYPASLREFARASELDPDDEGASYRLARAFFRTGQPEKEREVYLAAIAKRPHAWRPYWWLASWHFRQGDVDEAIAAYQAMVSRSPEYGRGYANLGGLLVLHGDYARAIETLERSIALQPSKAAYDNLGTAYFNSGRIAEALQAYNQSFQFGEADYATWLNLGDAYYWLRDRGDQAGDAYREAVRLGREEIASRAQRGQSFEVMIPANLSTVFPKLGQPDSARVYLLRALESGRDNPMVQYCAALTSWQLGERPAALDWLEKSVTGGYPTVWLRDSPIFHEWREEPRFRALVAGVNPGPQPSASRNPGASR